MSYILNLSYHGIVLALILLLAWGMFGLRDRRKQLMSAVVIIPFLLRFLNIK